MTISQRLVLCRSGRRVTQKEVAAAVGISERAYQRYEAEEREPLLSIAVLLADYFDVSLDFLVGRSDESGRR